MLFQVYWFVLVWSAGRPVSLVLAAVCTLLVIGQLAYFARPFRLSFQYLVIGVLIGLVMDTLLTVAGVHSPGRYVVPAPFVPIWLIGLWAAFVGYIRTGLNGMRGRYVLQFIAGAICEPLAWFGGVRMGSVAVNTDLLAAYEIMAVCWGLACLVLFRLSDIMQEQNE